MITVKGAYRCRKVEAPGHVITVRGVLVGIAAIVLLTIWAAMVWVYAWIWHHLGWI